MKPTNTLSACIVATLVLALLIIPEYGFAQVRRTKPPSTAASAAATKPQRRTTQVAYLKLTSPRQQMSNANKRNDRGQNGRSALGDAIPGGNRRNGVRLPGNVATSWTALNSASGPVAPQRTERQKASRNGRRVTFAAVLPTSRPASDVLSRRQRDPVTGSIIQNNRPAGNPPPR